VGASVQADLSRCQVIFGVKEMPVPFFEKKKTYIFFSHTIKGQKYNIPMLKQMMHMKCQLIDYEKIVDKDGKRLLFFGRHAGLAGMIDSLWALGKRLNWEGLTNPFSSIQPALSYSSLEEAKKAIRQVGDEIRNQGLPASLLPCVCGFAGYGHVSRGAQEIIDLLPVQIIEPDQLDTFMKEKRIQKDTHRLFKVVFHENHMVQPINDSHRFELNDYYQYPEKYQSIFKHYLPHLTLLINGIYWSPEYPRLVTKNDLRRLFCKKSGPRLRGIGDITCDIEGAIECTVRATTPDRPIFVYQPEMDTDRDGYKGPGVVVLAVDNLPCELPLEASNHFSETLLKYVPVIAEANYSSALEKSNLPPEIKNGVILFGGKLTPSYQYMKTYL
jgi:alpha-aminoadipic semialdehyde synthase